MINQVGRWLPLVALLLAGCNIGAPPVAPTRTPPPTMTLAPFQPVLPARAAPPIILHPAPTSTPGGMGVSFRRDVLPIFQANCIACHGGIAALHLDEYDYVLAGGINGPGVIPGNPDDSTILIGLETGFMPANAPPLPDEQIALIRRWVEEGAPNN